MNDDDDDDEKKNIQVQLFFNLFLQTVKFMAIAPEQPTIIACIIAELI